MDKYYTSQTIIENVASKIMNLLNSNSNSKSKSKSKNKIKNNETIYVVDFSAGDGRLGSKLIELGLSSNHLLEYDIEPKHERIITADWLKVKLPSHVKEFILTFNPPFGKSCHTACQFIDHALQLEGTRVFAAYLILPLYPVMFDNAKTHNVDLLPSNSFIYNDNEVSAPSCLHEVISRPSGFLNFKLYTVLSNKPYYYDINNLSDLIAHDTRNMKFSDVKHRLPIALIRKTGHYAGLTAIIIEKDISTVYYLNNNKNQSNKQNEINMSQKKWDALHEPIETRPWLSNDSRWRLTSFKDDNGRDGSRTGCGALKILPKEHGELLEPAYLHKKIKQFIEYVGENCNSVRGGGKGPQSIGIGTFYWITKFALADDI
jgi:hypothetical protein